MKAFAFMLAAACGIVSHSDGAPMRSRAEGLPGVESSNTVGLGDIWVSLGTEALFHTSPVPAEKLLGLADTTYGNDLRSLIGTGKLSRRELRLLPRLKAAFGLAPFAQFGLESVPWDGAKLGATTAWIKTTTPGNDHLRLFGASLALGATLSSEEDVYSRHVTTPGFEALFHLQAAVDADFIRYSVAYPVKFYLNYSTLDDHRLVRAYDQHKFQLAAEWKGYRGGPYVRMASLLYRRLPTRFDSVAGDPWKPLFHEVGVGWRWMSGDRFTFLAECSMDPIAPLAFYRDEARKPPQIRAEMSLPLFAQENQAEALRGLVFMEHRRRALRKEAARKPAAAKDSAGSPALPVDLDALSLGRAQNLKEAELLKDILGDKEKEIRERRQKVRSELKEIEELLE